MSTARATTLGDLLSDLAATHGDRPAVVGEEAALSFAELVAAADRWAGAFRAAGFGPGSHIGLLASNSPIWLTVAFGVWRAGATLVPISTFVTARELREILDHADVAALVVQPRLRSHDLIDLVAQARGPQLREVIVLAADAPADYRAASTWLAAGPAAGAITIDPASIACILYTSGTTGQAKGVMLSHRAILATVIPSAERTGLGPHDSLLSTLPLFWVAGLVIRALPTLATGCALLLVETFTVEGLIAMLRRHRPTALHLRPPQVGLLLADPGCSPELLDRVHRGGGRTEWFGPALSPDTRLTTGYGMTEMAGYVTALAWDDPPDTRRVAVGTALPGVEIRVVTGDGALCAAGETGAIRVRGPGLFSGYYKQPPGTAIDDAGFLITGDLGHLDDNGAFHFVGREKDLLRVKGINVSPVEVETVLGAHPAVEAAYVVGLPPDGLDQRVVALIVPQSAEAPPPEADLRALAADALSHYKRPEQYIWISRGDVPLGGTSKPQRAALAEMATQRIADA